eukprot:TRINITY_DN27664_c0_g1_i1.p1 TRINITY_DN27664_c0_g1~~TRINITY_DN27664_c0_g1_i1.p1  ORF type:complete len:317 (+),score=57.50 TRINITY_DN27664_c0_g1_i1:87-953(+)
MAAGLLIHLRGQTGEEIYAVELPSDATVADLQAAAAERFAAPAGRLQLEWQGAPLLDNSQSLADAGVCSEATIQCRTQPRLFFDRVCPNLTVGGELKDEVTDFEAVRSTGSAVANVPLPPIGGMRWRLEVLEEAMGGGRIDRCWDVGVCSEAFRDSDDALTSCPLHAASGTWVVRAYDAIVCSNGERRYNHLRWAGSYAGCSIVLEVSDSRMEGTEGAERSADAEGEGHAHSDAQDGAEPGRWLSVTPLKPDGTPLGSTRLVQIPTGVTLYPVVGFQTSGVKLRISAE